MKKILFLLLLLIPTISVAESTINCHCFQDRSYNQRKSAAADPYFLATTQNSFLSLAYKVDKRNIVKAKMAGENGAQLWILFDLAQRSKKSITQVKKIYAETNRWPDTFKKLKLSALQLDKRYRQLGSNPEQLANHIVDLQLGNFFEVTLADIGNWRNQGMNRKELILAILLDGNPATIYHQVASGMKTWGELLSDQGLVDSDTINKKLKQHMFQL